MKYLLLIFLSGCAPVCGMVIPVWQPPMALKKADCHAPPAAKVFYERDLLTK